MKSSNRLAQARGGEVPAGADRAKLVRRARAAGPAVVPRLIARPLLDRRVGGRLGLSPARPRSAARASSRALEQLCSERRVGRDQGARARAALRSAGADAGARAAAAIPRRCSAAACASCSTGSTSPDEIDQAVALIVDQVPEPEVPAFVAELVRHGGKKAAPVIKVLSARGGLTDETVQALDTLYREATATAADRAALEALERGLEYLEAGRPRAARRRLERFVASASPTTPRGAARSASACSSSTRSTPPSISWPRPSALEPQQALHRWNLASAAKQADRMGGCYLALRDYLALPDDSDGAVERRDEAKSFVRAYERMLRGNHPGVPLRDVLRGEELFARAYAALSEGRNAEAANGFENVLALVPRHYPSWGNLGAAYLALERTAEAQRCLERALELNPEYTIAKHNLLLIQAGSLVNL